MTDMSKVPPSLRAGIEQKAALKALPSLIRRLEAVEQWAEQNGWDVATGMVKSDLSETKKAKRGRPSNAEKEASDAAKGVADGNTSTEPQQ